jgi:hypothetical protein
MSAVVKLDLVISGVVMLRKLVNSMTGCVAARFIGARLITAKRCIDVCIEANGLINLRYSYRKASKFIDNIFGSIIKNNHVVLSNLKVVEIWCK